MAALDGGRAAQIVELPSTPTPTPTTWAGEIGWGEESDRTGPDRGRRPPARPGLPLGVGVNYGACHRSPILAVHRGAWHSRDSRGGPGAEAVT